MAAKASCLVEIMDLFGRSTLLVLILWKLAKYDLLFDMIFDS